MTQYYSKLKTSHLSSFCKHHPSLSSPIPGNLPPASAEAAASLTPAGCRGHCWSSKARSQPSPSTRMEAAPMPKIEQHVYISVCHWIYIIHPRSWAFSTWKSVPGKGDSFWKPSFSGSMLDFGGVHHISGICSLEVPITDASALPRSTASIWIFHWDFFSRLDS